MAVGITLGGPDLASIRLLNGWPNGLCLSPLIEHHTEELNQFLIKKYFENGAALFGRESSYEMEMVREVVGEPFANLDLQVISHIVHYYVVRVRNYAHIESLMEGYIEKARVRPVDQLTPTTCLGHGGRLVNVTYAAGRIAWFKTLTHAQYGMGVYNKDYGFPPFDILCTCSVQAIFRLADNNSYDRPTKVTRTKWDRLAHIHAIMSKYEDASQMTPAKFEEFLGFAVGVADELVENGDPQSKLERLIGESLVARGRFEEALSHLQKAVNSRPKVGCQKLLSKLKMEKSLALAPRTGN